MGWMSLVLHGLGVLQGPVQDSTMMGVIQPLFDIRAFEASGLVRNLHANPSLFISYLIMGASFSIDPSALVRYL